MLLPDNHQRAACYLSCRPPSTIFQGACIPQMACKARPSLGVQGSGKASGVGGTALEECHNFRQRTTDHVSVRFPMRLSHSSLPFRQSSHRSVRQRLPSSLPTTGRIGRLWQHGHSLLWALSEGWSGDGVLGIDGKSRLALPLRPQALGLLLYPGACGHCWHTVPRSPREHPASPRIRR